MGKVLDTTSRNDLLSILNCSFDSIDDYTATLAYVNVAVLFSNDQDPPLDKTHLKALVSYLKESYFAKENTLIELLLALLTGAQFDEAGFKLSYFKSAHPSTFDSFTPDLPFLLELAAVLDLVGRKKRLPSLVNKARLLMKVLLGVALPKTKALYACFSTSDKGEFSQLNLLVELVTLLLHTESTKERKEQLEDIQQTLNNHKCRDLPLLIMRMIEQAQGPLDAFDHVSCPDDTAPIEQLLGLHLIKQDEFQGGVFSKGANLSTGFLKKQDVEITAMGPIKGSLDAMDRFGIYRNIPLEKPPTCFWSRCIDIKDGRYFPSLDTLFFGLHLDPSKVLIQTYLKKQEGSTGGLETFFTFFVTASFLVVNGETRVEKQCVKGFQGNAHSLDLVGEKGRMKWSFSKEIFIHIAPLPCKGFFWETSFLIAYSLEGVKRTFQIEII